MASPELIEPLWDPQAMGSGVESPKVSSGDAQQYRYVRQHHLLKLAKWIGRDDEIADLMAAGATHWIAVSWFHARNQRFPGIDQAVMHWREQQPEMIEPLIGAAQERRLRDRRIARASELALAPVGGLWREGDTDITGVRGTPRQEKAAGARALLGELTGASDRIGGA